jgi:hypothetical protein
MKVFIFSSLPPFVLTKLAVDIATPPELEYALFKILVLGL